MSTMPSSSRGKTMFLAPRMIPYFHAIWGMRARTRRRRLSKHARAILKVLRKEWELATSDLRDEAGVKDRATFTKAMDELQAAMIVVPSAAVYEPKFTYIWELAVGRFPDALVRRVKRDVAVKEIARCFLAGAGMTIPGELARVTGLSRAEAGRGNLALVAEGYATMLEVEPIGWPPAARSMRPPTRKHRGCPSHSRQRSRRQPHARACRCGAGGRPATRIDLRDLDIHQDQGTDSPRTATISALSLRRWPLTP